MKGWISAATLALAGVCLASFAFANPAMLPKHPGYPIGKPTSPVTGQTLANDTGQSAVDAAGTSAIINSAEASDKHVSQSLQDPNNNRIKKKMGAGRLPQVSGPDIKINPPVKEATKMK